jgi:hypothetical protein
MIDKEIIDLLIKVAEHIDKSIPLGGEEYELLEQTMLNQSLKGSIIEGMD